MVKSLQQVGNKLATSRRGAEVVLRLVFPEDGFAPNATGTRAGVEVAPAAVCAPPRPGVLCVAGLVFSSSLWLFSTSAASDQRLLLPATLPSPSTARWDVAAAAAHTTTSAAFCLPTLALLIATALAFAPPTNTCEAGLSCVPGDLIPFFPNPTAPRFCACALLELPRPAFPSTTLPSSQKLERNINH